MLLVCSTKMRLILKYLRVKFRCYIYFLNVCIYSSAINLSQDCIKKVFLKK